MDIWWTLGNITQDSTDLRGENVDLGKSEHSNAFSSAVKI